MDFVVLDEKALLVRIGWIGVEKKSGHHNGHTGQNKPVTVGRHEPRLPVKLNYEEITILIN